MAMTTGAAANGDYALSLCGHWTLEHEGSPVVLKPRERRVVSSLALLGEQTRRHIAGVLWPDVPERHALGSLRASLTHLRCHAPGLLDITPSTVALAASVSVDLERLERFARETMRAPQDADDVARVLADAELLPGWDEDWLAFARERMQQLRLEALEAAARKALQDGQTAAAVWAAQLAHHIEPLRETPMALAIEAHIAEGNRAEAVREYVTFRRMLGRELGILPSERLTATVRVLRVERPHG
ncbi:AfsR/SARP family transcriptional regulator [Mumia sp. DW29H23]|uniref:AfsR/SARP family transcriptional regulator n=1 Tax=Mumia sp. DW29H23 TaxID=3421241 RepID=UPI003D681A8D